MNEDDTFSLPVTELLSGEPSPAHRVERRKYIITDHSALLVAIVCTLVAIIIIVTGIVVCPKSC